LFEIRENGNWGNKLFNLPKKGLIFCYRLLLIQVLRWGSYWQAKNLTKKCTLAATTTPITTGV